MNKKINELKQINKKTTAEKIASLEKMRESLNRLAEINNKKTNENK